MYLVTLQKVKLQEITGLKITRKFQTVVGIFILSRQKKKKKKLLQNETDGLVALEVIIWL